MLQVMKKHGDDFKTPFHKRAGTSIITIGQPAIDRLKIYLILKMQRPYNG